MATWYRLGIDVGGTFTDFVLVDDEGNLTEAKTASTPSNPGEAIQKGLSELGEQLGLTESEVLGRCSLFIHGTTVALNALLQHRGAKTGLICTEGFRDSLEIRLGYRDAQYRYDFGHPPPQQLVPRRLRLPVRERIDKAGKVLVPLSEEDARRCVDRLGEEGVEAVAIGLLWSFYNPVHEQRLAELIRRELPHCYLSLSSEVAPQIGEYDRVSTTVLNAYIGPVLLDYLRRTEDLLRSLGYAGEIRYIQSNGGIASPDVIAQRPILCLNSGPAAAPAAGLFYGHLLQEKNLITMDMGGTSFDACLIEDGTPRAKDATDVHRYRLVAPMLDINTIGAGGGSIAWLDVGLLRVGPQSAGAVPGPACYMRGGSLPTVTDADVVLGYLNPRVLLGGRFPIDAGLGRAAIAEKIAVPLGVTVEEASRGIFEVVNRSMANAISEISLERGYDPREFVVVAAGGQGAVHAAAIVKDLEIGSIIVPKNASTFCAFGALVTSIRHDYRRSHAVRLSALDPAHLEQDFAAMEAKGYAEMAMEGVPRYQVRIARSLAMRYAEQIFEVAVDVTNLQLGAGCVPALREKLDAQHEKEYTYRHTSGDGEIISAMVTMTGPPPIIRLLEQAGESVAASAHIKETRPVFFSETDAYCDTPVFDGPALRPGHVLSGPAIVEENHTTIVVPPEWRLELTPYRCYLMRCSGVN
jgi:N-methylhydantoinase A